MSASMSETMQEAMPETMKQHGTFSWNELMTTDINSAKTFYAKLFNWEMEDLPMDQPYTLAKVGGNEVAGLMPMPPGEENMPAMWGGYVTVDDIEASMQHAQDLGGKVLLEPREIPDLGRFGVIADPQGAPLSMISYFAKN